MKLLVGIIIFISLICAISISVAPNIKNMKDVPNIIENGEQNISQEQNNEPELLQIYDIEEGYIWVPYVKNIEHNSYNWDKLKIENGYLKYEDEKYISKLGIDVSHYQGNVEWKKVKEAGIEFVIIRLGYRGYGNGKLMIDKKFHEFVKGAIQEEIGVGAYFFSQAINEQEAIEEAQFVLDNIREYNITYPVCFDTEKIKNDTSRTEQLSTEERTNIAVTFCEKINEYGYVPMVYANAKWLTTSLDLHKLQQYQIWYADYQEKPIYPYNFTMWQYTETR